MNPTLVRRIADAVLYEGYILYPYRPSVKNRQRWTFGGLYPEAYCRSQGSGEFAGNQTECLVQGDLTTTFSATVRFLQLTERLVGAINQPPGEWLEGEEIPYRPVERLQVGDRIFQGWQEAEEREVNLPGTPLMELLTGTKQTQFHFPGGRRLEPVREPDGRIVGVLIRRQQTVEGSVAVNAVAVAKGLFRLTFRVLNCTPLEENECPDRDAALLRTLASTHSILSVSQGDFVSLIDPPEVWREAAAGCVNIGAWPVFVGSENAKDTMLSAPIILYDYPEIAPESPGDFFDGTEIDEMLTLRILTLTDEEKQAMAALDPRAGALLARTESLAREQLYGLHGTLRNIHPVAEDKHGELGP